ncbi:MAG: STAS domain-containing protein [Rhodocyclaceae bacterium]|nr:STAS domain-containing protein [Rhodocyclaceae bacterium]
MIEPYSKSVIEVSKDEWHAHLPGNFNFQAAHNLIKDLRHLGETPPRLRLNFARTEQIDRSGLGGLLCLADIYSEQGPIIVEKANLEIRKMLNMVMVVGRLSFDQGLINSSEKIS